MWKEPPKPLIAIHWLWQWQKEAEQQHWQLLGQAVLWASGWPWDSASVTVGMDTELLV